MSNDRSAKGPDPIDLARRDLAKSLPKRFYGQAGIGLRDGLPTLLLDGRPARTPARHPLAHPSEAAMRLVAAEWAAQGETIDPATMPATRLVNVAIDAVGARMAEVAADVVAYAGSDLVCYRAEEPDSLVAAEAGAWDPALDWARRALGARFALAAGVMHVDQPAGAIEAVRRRVAAIADPLALAGLHAMTALLGSALLALAVLDGAFPAEQAWSAAHVGEDHQMRLWGADAEALARRARRWEEMRAAAALVNAVSPPRVI
jgi:chaperone required for assembly of F1-ATPase